MRFPPSNTVLWFAVLGGPCAWVAQFATNVFLGFAQCDASPGRWTLPLHTLQIVLSVGAVVVDLAATAIALWLYLRTREIENVAGAGVEDVAAEERAGKGSLPPTGRINFLATVGLTVNFLALAILIMSGIGAPLLPICQQS